MAERVGKVRRFSASTIDGWYKMGDFNIHLGPAIEKSEGGPLSAYFARFGKGEIADLPAPYAEIWVIIKGGLTIRDGDLEVSARAGEFLHVPTESPGQVVADGDTELVCVSVPGH
jgi:ethanolamine utilization protein EutQ (cupin superfamily)